jgi:uroporphyrinogen-III synthase
METTGFGGLRVLALENRRATEITTLIQNNGGSPTVVPIMREVPLESNQEAIAFAERLIAGDIDLVLLLTGAGTRILFNVVETRFPREEILAALRRIRIAVRGPKPVAVLREWGLSAQIVAQEPGTWRELLAALDQKVEPGLRGMRIAVQEYGAPAADLLAGLAARGAAVTCVPVYQWALPEDLTGVRQMVDALVRGDFDVVLFLTGTQAVHLCQVAEQMGKRSDLLNAMRRIAVISVGQSTTAELVRQGIQPDFHPSHPKMGIMVKEAADAVPRILREKAAFRGFR